ncbi:MAG: type III-B CRISPR module-associated protein Cmr5 [Desulfobacca sp. 4484_104]|nr:MAG: type III-B CRISPR module-associated protein Cmr5 [Desulfobacca sp. 4484_104]
MNKAKPSKRQTLEQMRYWAAYKFAQEAKGKPGDFSRYVNLAKKFPAMVNANGLGQALAYLAAKRTKKGDSAEELLLKHLGRWLTRSDDNRNFYYAPPYAVDYAEGVLLANIRENNSRTYLRATVEALQLLNYLKLVASGLETEPETKTEGA